MVTCIDISKWQAGIDLTDWSNEDGFAVIAKASEGVGIRDANYDDYRQQCENLDLSFAAYHFLRPGGVTDQALWFLDCATPDLGSRIVCDWEDPGNSDGDVQAFMQAIRNQRPDLQLTVYCSAAFGPAQVNNPWLSQNTSLWVARYTTADNPYPIPPIWPTWSLWQYSDNGSIPGYGSPVDANRFNGPDSQMLKWFGPVDQAPAGVATVDITIEGNVRVTVNGTTVYPGAV
jgi:lysozyme